ncbi:hypothetical protein SRB5_69800 [Streptomyces sp. RB5]|uniref:SWIM-type domain-containing protein n=1 Tax=Streptomyces smaragdinus TaxID=2585196 RepID=A0A7K0CTG7_9ACTN|nr:SWIM zinc finger family protein [Streptomyces smaragdinus]MQY16777.1 hypothetical protein [Streptomyces smaragdinus]
MTETQQRWTGDQVLALATDTASRQAAGHLAVPASWRGCGAGADSVWGQYEGGGSSPYRTAVDLTGPAYSCGCPSRKSPCKHALALLLLWSRGEVPDAAGPADWAGEWLRARRERADRKRGDSKRGDGKKEESSADPEAARRRAEQRLRRIAAGATELEQRLADVLRDGLASAPAREVWEETAARMVDAQAPGLAARVRELGALPASGPGWPSRFLSELALLHLLGRGFLRLADLPEPLAATVRTRVGLTHDTARLLAGGTVRDSWLVLAQDDQDDGRLTTRRIWLYGQESRRFALLLSYGAAGRAPDLALPTGLAQDAGLAYYPGAHPLRAALGDRHAAPAPAPVPPGTDLDAAIRSYAEALRLDPWLDAVPVILAGVVPIPGSGADPWQLATPSTGDALPLDPRATGLWQLLAVSGGIPLTVFGELGHEGFRPLTTWSGETPVRLQAGG